MRISVVGSGYVGLVAAGCFADMGNNVICLDIDEARVGLLSGGKIPIHEPGLDAVVRRGMESKRLRFTTSYDEAVEHADIFFLAVGTPPDEDGSADIKYVLSAARSIGERLSKPAIIVNKSTVPVGTARQVEAAIETELRSRNVTVPIAVVSNPEFLKEGAAIDDFMKPDRIIIGSSDTNAIDTLRRLYAPFCRNHEKILTMDVASAELTKYAANAMLATRISFMNELANLAESIGADIESVRHGLGSDPRIGSHFLYSGCGYGGSCFPKDVKALVRTGQQNGHAMRILDAVEYVNEQQKHVLYKKICEFFSSRGGLRGKVIAVWGLAFKPNTDDMREASSRVLISSLVGQGALVRAYDPVAGNVAAQLFSRLDGVSICESALHALEGCDVLVVVTEWKEFQSVEMSSVRMYLKERAIFDGRNIYDPAEVRASGLAYFGIGRQ